MSNVRDPQDPLSDPAFAALVRFVENGPNTHLAPVIVGVDHSSGPDGQVASVFDLVGTAPLRQIGLNDDEIRALTAFAERHGKPALSVAADWLRCVMDTIETVG